MPYKEKLISFSLEVVDTILNIIITLAVVFFIRTFIFSPFLISGVSMASTLKDNEYILVNKMGYSNVFGFELGKPERGDIVVLKAPLVNTDDNVYYIKRVIGLPGETIGFRKDKVVIFNQANPDGLELNEDYIRCKREDKPCSEYSAFFDEKFKVPEDSYFVMGDNRDQSTDSRSCFYSCSLTGSTNYIRKENILGKSSVVLWPFSKARFID